MEDQLAGLKEIPLPEAVAYTPQTAGWYVLLALVLMGFLWFLYRWKVRASRNRYRIEALERLSEIEQGVAPLSELPVLVKQVVLAFAPRERVAGLSGVPWLEFLDSTFGGREFTSGPGQVLPALSYERSEMAEKKMKPEERRRLFALLRRWIRRHRAGI